MLPRLSGCVMGAAVAVLVAPAHSRAQLLAGHYDIPGNYDNGSNAAWGVGWDHGEAVPTSLRRCPAAQVTDRISGVASPRVEGTGAGRFFIDGNSDPVTGDRNAALKLSCRDPCACPVDTNNSSVERAELIWLGTSVQSEGNELWYRWWSRFNSPGAPDAFNYVLGAASLTGHFNIFTQFKNRDPDGLGPNIAINILPPAADRFRPETNILPAETTVNPALIYLDHGLMPSGDPGIGTHRLFLGELTPNMRDKWIEFVIHIRWSSGNDGLVEAWCNGIPGIDPDTRGRRISGKTLYSPSEVADNSVFLKQGLYRAFQPSPTTIFHDGLTVTRTDPRTMYVTVPSRTGTVVVQF